MTTRMLKKVVALLLAVLMLASVAACAPAATPSTGTASKDDATSNAPASSGAASTEDKYFNEEGLPICDTTISITAAGGANSTPDPQKTDMIAFIKDKMGIDITYSMFAGDAWATQYNLAKTTDKLWDFISPGAPSGGWADVSVDGADGYLMDWTPYLQYMPNMAGYIDTYEDFRKTITAPDGKIYGFGRYTANLIGGAQIGTFWIRESWLKNVNMEVPKTVDELYNVLKAFKEQDADKDGTAGNQLPLGYIPDWTGRYLEMILLAAFGCYTHSAPYLYGGEDGKVGTYATTDGYKEYLKYMAKLYKEGIIEKEAFTGGTAFNENKTNMKYGAVSHMTYTNAQMNIWDSVMVTGLTSDVCDKVALAKRPGTAGPQTLMSANTEYPEAIARMVDWYMHPDNIHKWGFGMEGIHFDWVEKSVMDGKIKFWEKDFDKYVKAAGYENSNDLIYKKAVVHNMFQLGFLDSKDSYVMWDKLSLDELKAFRDWSIENNTVEEYVDNSQAAMNIGVKGLGNYEVIDIYPNLAYLPDEITELGTLKTDLSTFITASQAEFIIGTRDIDTGWDAYLAQIKGMGLDKILEIEQAAYDRYNK